MSESILSILCGRIFVECRQEAVLMGDLDDIIIFQKERILSPAEKYSQSVIERSLFQVGAYEFKEYNLTSKVITFGFLPPFLCSILPLQD